MIRIFEKEILISEAVVLTAAHFDINQNLDLTKRNKYFFEAATNKKALIDTLKLEIVIDDFKRIDSLTAEEILKVNSPAVLAMLYVISCDEKYKNESVRVTYLCGTKEEINFCQVYTYTLNGVYRKFNKEIMDNKTFKELYGESHLYIKGARKSPLTSILHPDKYKDKDGENKKLEDSYIFCPKCKQKHKYNLNLIEIEHRKTRQINGRYETGLFRTSATFKCENEECKDKFVIKLQEFEAEILELSDTQLQNWSLEKIKNTKSLSNEK